tara:strand:- start:2296 stop:3945 length:1650 start_codon:yes stop_codon:yes gene_type:complete
MKKILLVLIAISLSIIAFPQSVPQGINYQAVARDSSGKELINKALNVKLSVISGTSTGNISWQETHSVTTNDYGLFTVVIGNGASTGLGSSSTFDLVDWGFGNHFLKIEINDGGGTYINMGTNELLSVPYALMAPDDNDWKIGAFGSLENVKKDWVRIIGNDTLGELMIAPNLSSVNHKSQLLLMEDYNGNYGVNLHYDGTDNKFKIFGNNSISESGPHLVVQRDDGKIGIGTNFPAFKLDVSGDINFSGNIYKNGSLFNVGDNLGNHTATQNINMDYNRISNIESMDLQNISSTGATRIDFSDNTGSTTCGIIVGNTGFAYGEDMKIFNNRASGGIVLESLYNNLEIGVNDINIKGNNGNTMIKIEANETANQGGQINLNKYDGTNTISIDADYFGVGRITTEELQITGGSDLAENFDIFSQNVKIRPGMVVSINTQKAGALTISNTSYDKKVIGIISGANDVRTGMIMGQKGSIADGEFPVAITGRVYAFASNMNGKIEAGDLLTTSTKAGYLMKATDKNRAFGSIVGKAMTNLEEESGFVLIVITR